MNSHKLPLSGRIQAGSSPAVPAAASPVNKPAETSAPALSLPVAAVLLGLGAVLVAAGCAWGLDLLLPAGWSSDGLAAASGAALGVAAAALPAGWLIHKLMREAAPVGPEHGRAGVAGTAPSAGMPRALFLDLAEREWARARRYGTGAALLLVDVDRYTRLCEARGTAAGNAVLAELLRQTAPTLRTADVLTRFSASQMAVFLAHADATGALDVAERIRERVEQLEIAWPSAAVKQRLRVTASVGVAHLRAAHLNLQSLIEDAEDAVLASRQANGNCVRSAPVENARSRGAAVWRDERRVKRSPPP